MLYMILKPKHILLKKVSMIEKCSNMLYKFLNKETEVKFKEINSFDELKEQIEFSKKIDECFNSISYHLCHIQSKIILIKSY